MRTLGWLCVWVAGFTACGPGRQAAWDKQVVDSGLAADGTPDANALTQEAGLAWEHRIERAACEKAIGLWRDLATRFPDKTEYWSKLSRAYYFMADTHLRFAEEPDEEAMLQVFEKGVEAGERAMMSASAAFAQKVRDGEKVEEVVQLLPAEAQEGIYWYAANLGKFAVAKGFTTTLFYKDRIFAVMQQVLALDETFFYAAPHRYFGAFYAKAPSFAGGDMDKSRFHFDKALELGPEYFGTKVLFADYYAKKSDDRGLFEKLLLDVRDGNPTEPSSIAPEQAFEQRKAAQLLSEIDDHF